MTPEEIDAEIQAVRNHAKIGIDTNILVSSLLARGYPSRIIRDFVLEKKVVVGVSGGFAETLSANPLPSQHIQNFCTCK